jgi:hypothetical protein
MITDDFNWARYRSGDSVGHHRPPRTDEAYSCETTEPSFAQSYFLMRCNVKAVVEPFQEFLQAWREVGSMSIEPLKCHLRILAKAPSPALMEIDVMR